MSEEELRTIEFDEPVGSLVVDIPYWHDDGIGAGTGAFLWDGSIMLSQTLCAFHAAEGDQAKYQLGGRVVELGAGSTALPSMVAARLGCFDEVIATDLDTEAGELAPAVSALAAPLGLQK